jgi:hypothetical protein
MEGYYSTFVLSPRRADQAKLLTERVSSAQEYRYRMDNSLAYPIPIVFSLFPSFSLSCAPDSQAGAISD